MAKKRRIERFIVEQKHHGWGRQWYHEPRQPGRRKLMDPLFTGKMDAGEWIHRHSGKARVLSVSKWSQRVYVGAGRQAHCRRLSRAGEGGMTEYFVSATSLDPTGCGGGLRRRRSAKRCSAMKERKGDQHARRQDYAQWPVEGLTAGRSPARLEGRVRLLAPCGSTRRESSWKSGGRLTHEFRYGRGGSSLRWMKWHDRDTKPREQTEISSE